jgi:hypothetical protein
MRRDALAPLFIRRTDRLKLACMFAIANVIIPLKCSLKCGFVRLRLATEGAGSEP